MPKRKKSDRVQIGLRVREAMRRDLESVAKKRGVSLNAEIETRLERSFGDEDIIERLFGGESTVRLMRALTLAKGMVEASDGHDFFSSYDTAWKVREAVMRVLDALMPADPRISQISPSQEAWERDLKDQAKRVAELVVASAGFKQGPENE